jgi:hypothetical protein
MAKKEYAHLVKPLRVQEPPKGLYGGARVWMEGKDLEGFNAHFTYGNGEKGTYSTSRPFPSAPKGFPTCRK